MCCRGSSFDELWHLNEYTLEDKLTLALLWLNRFQDRRFFGLVAPTARGLAIVSNAREALRILEALEPCSARFRFGP